MCGASLQTIVYTAPDQAHNEHTHDLETCMLSTPQQIVQGSTEQSALPTTWNSTNTTLESNLICEYGEKKGMSRK